jgi:hypothetical protein
LLTSLQSKERILAELLAQNALPDFHSHESLPVGFTRVILHYFLRGNHLF